MDVHEINSPVDRQHTKAKAVTEEGMNDSIEQHLFGNVTFSSFVAGVKFLAQKITNAVGRILENLTNVNAFAAFLRRTDQQAVGHLAFLATIRY
jgi:hypothetical protein